MFFTKRKLLLFHLTKTKCLFAHKNTVKQNIKKRSQINCRKDKYDKGLNTSNKTLSWPIQRQGNININMLKLQPPIGQRALTLKLQLIEHQQLFFMHMRFSQYQHAIYVQYESTSFAISSNICSLFNFVSTLENFVYLFFLQYRPRCRPTTIMFITTPGSSSFFNHIQHYFLVFRCLKDNRNTHHHQMFLRFLKSRQPT